MTQRDEALREALGAFIDACISEFGDKTYLFPDAFSVAYWKAREALK